MALAMALGARPGCDWIDSVNRLDLRRAQGAERRSLAVVVDGLGGGILGSSFVATVVFLVETALADVRDREAWVSREIEREQLLQSMPIDVTNAIDDLVRGYLAEDIGERVANALEACECARAG